MDLDTDVTISQIHLMPMSTLNVGTHTIALTNPTPFTSDSVDTFNAGTGTVVLSDADISLYGADYTYNNLIMEPLTASCTVTLGGPTSGWEEIITVNGYFISGSSTTNQVSFVKGNAASDVANAVTSYYCAGNGGISNINCVAGGPTAPTGFSATAVSQTQIDLSWTCTADDETGFKIFRNGVLIDNIPGPNLVTWANTTVAANATSYSDTGLTAGTTYNYEIRTTVLGTDSTGVTDSATTMSDAPSVTAVSSPANGSYKAGDTISITVTFSESVVVTGTPQLTLKTGTTDAVLDLASASGDTLTFSYTVADGHTSTDLDYAATDSLALNGGTIQNGSGKDAVLTLPTPGAANSLGDNNDIVIDTTAPTVVLSTTASNPTNASPFSVTITFSEDVNNFDVGDISVTNGTPGTPANLTPRQVWTADITPTSDGMVTVDINAGAAQDDAGNDSTAATQLSLNYDGTAPTVTIGKASGQDDPTTSTTINFTVVFSESVSNFATGDVTLGGTAGATTATVTGSGTTYNVAVSGMTSAGTVTASIAANVATDSAGNNNAAATSTDNEVDFTPPPPSVSSINRVGTTPTNAASVDFTVTFSESISSGIDTSDFVLATTGTSGSVASVSAASGTSVTVTVNSVSGDGTLGLNLTDDDSIKNGMNVPIGGTGNGNGNFTGQAYTIDNTAPTVTINKASGQDDPTSSTTINFTVVFSESVSNFATGDVTLGGTAGATTATVTGSGTTYNVAVTGMTSAGTVYGKCGFR